MSTVHDRIKERLSQLGKSSRRASLDSGLSEFTIAKLLKTEHSQTLDTIRKLAVGLETSAQWLAFGSTSSHDGGSGVSESAPHHSYAENTSYAIKAPSGKDQINVDRKVLRAAIVEGIRVARNLRDADEDRLAAIVIESLSAPPVDPSVVDPVVSTRIYVGLTANGTFNH